MRRLLLYRLRLPFVLFAALLTFSHCAVLEDLMTEPTYGPVVKAPGKRPAKTAPEPGTGTDDAAAPADELRLNIVDFARQHIGTPYTYAGTSPETGFDCSGFTSFVLSNFDIDLSRTSRSQATEGQKIRPEQARPGDLVFFRRSRNGSVFHVAMVVDNSKNGLEVVHSTTSRGVIQENISRSGYWKPLLSDARAVISR